LINGNNIGEILNASYEVLKAEGIETYMIDVQLLLAKALNKDRLYIVMNREMEVEKEAVKTFENFLELRRNKVPVKYITEECEFMGLELFVKKGVLIPRPDTEILVEEVIDIIKKKGYRYICDVCSGSGAIGVSIGKIVEEVEVECYDISLVAEEVNKINIDRLGLDGKVKFYHSDLLGEAIKHGKVFDAIISNPPYIKEAVIPTLMEDVKDYEPHLALSGGVDGLAFYRDIIEQSNICLKKGGLLAFEIGFDQKEEVSELMSQKGLIEIKCIQDLAGNDRVLIGIKE
jgi:release factor glutamine methyltransferase